MTEGTQDRVGDGTRGSQRGPRRTRAALRLTPGDLRGCRRRLAVQLRTSPGCEDTRLGAPSRPGQKLRRALPLGLRGRPRWRRACGLQPHLAPGAPRSHQREQSRGDDVVGCLLTERHQRECHLPSGTASWPVVSFPRPSRQEPGSDPACAL